MADNNLYNRERNCFHVDRTYPEFLEYITTHAEEWEQKAAELIGSFLYFSPGDDCGCRFAVVDTGGKVYPVDSMSVKFGAAEDYDSANNILTLDNTEAVRIISAKSIITGAVPVPDGGNQGGGSGEEVNMN